jgi:hypothetical protein
MRSIRSGLYPAESFHREFTLAARSNIVRLSFGLGYPARARRIGKLFHLPTRNEGDGCRKSTNEITLHAMAATGMDTGDTMP